MRRVKNIFIKETSDNLAVLEEELKDHNTLSKEAVEMVIRTMHNIKGAAPMVGFSVLPEIAIPIEQAYRGILENGLVVNDNMVENTKTAVTIIQDLLKSEETRASETDGEQKVLIDYFNTITG